MLTLLHRFAALTLLLSALHTLLPDSTMRRTAMMCAGLIVAVCWLDALQESLRLPQPDVPFSSLFTSTEVSAGNPDAALDVYLRRLGSTCEE